MCDNILHTPTTFSLTVTSGAFSSTTHLWLDGLPRDRVGDDGRAVVVRAWCVRPGQRLPADVPVPLHPQGSGLTLKCLHSCGMLPACCPACLLLATCGQLPGCRAFWRPSTLRCNVVLARVWSQDDCLKR